MAIWTFTIHMVIFPGPAYGYPDSSQFLVMLGSVSRQGLCMKNVAFCPNFISNRPHINCSNMALLMATKPHWTQGPESCTRNSALPILILPNYQTSITFIALQIVNKWPKQSQLGINSQNPKFWVKILTSNSQLMHNTCKSTCFSFLLVNQH